VLALAYPDRVAQARGDGRFRLRSGAGAWLPTGDPLSGERYLVVADLGRDTTVGGRSSAPRSERAHDDLRIHLAAALDEEDIEAAAGDAVEQVATLRWDEDRDDLRVRAERRLGAIVLSSVEGPATASAATTAALIDCTRRTSLRVLSWSDSARTFQARAGFARRALGDQWPDLSDEALVATLESWLAPRLAGATRRADLERTDVLRALRDLVGHHRAAELDRLLPRTLAIASGHEVPIDYRGEMPAIAVRVQELFGTTVHPSVAHGRIPLAVHLLSPAGRPVQITSDLPGFWHGSWAEVRKEMSGRYPKHPWPVDAAAASPPARRSPRPRT